MGLHPGSSPALGGADSRAVQVGGTKKEIMEPNLMVSLQHLRATPGLKSKGCITQLGRKGHV